MTIRKSANGKTDGPRLPSGMATLSLQIREQRAKAQLEDAAGTLAAVIEDVESLGAGPATVDRLRRLHARILDCMR